MERRRGKKKGREKKRKSLSKESDYTTAEASVSPVFSLKWRGGRKEGG